MRSPTFFVVQCHWFGCTGLQLTCSSLLQSHPPASKQCHALHAFVLLLNLMLLLDLPECVLHVYLQVWQDLEVEKLGSGSFSYLLTWQGSDASLAPALFISHVDVVPVTKGTEQDWKHPPFSGAVADGFIWGAYSLVVVQCKCKCKHMQCNLQPVAMRCNAACNAIISRHLSVEVTVAATPQTIHEV